MWIKHSRKWVWVFYSRVPFFVKIELLTYLPLYAVPLSQQAETVNLQRPAGPAD